MALTIREESPTTPHLPRPPFVRLSAQQAAGCRAAFDVSGTTRRVPPFRLRQARRPGPRKRRHHPQGLAPPHVRSALYALKVLHYGDSSAAAEMDILRRTDSPYIVRCHSVLPAASGDVVLLLELVDGCSLDSLVARRGAHGGFPEPALAEVAAQRLSSLAYLQARRIVHRDIKPANILVSEAGEVKIADFGIAKVLSRAGNHCTIDEGTAAYMCPERFDTERHDDPYAGDVWSLGLTVLELLMGRYPLLPAGQKPSWAALMCAICFGEPPALPEGAVSPELRGFVAACLQRDYTKRASVEQLLAHPFVAKRDAATSSHALRRLVAEASGHGQCSASTLDHSY